MAHRRSSHQRNTRGGRFRKSRSDKATGTRSKKGRKTP